MIMKSWPLIMKGSTVLTIEDTGLRIYEKVKDLLPNLKSFSPCYLPYVPFNIILSYII